MDISENAAPAADSAPKKPARKSRAKAAAGTIDQSETRESLQRKKWADEKSARKASVKVTDWWYERAGNKIVKKSKMTNGNMHTSFVCLATPKNKDLIATLKKQMKSPSKEL